MTEPSPRLASNVSHLVLLMRNFNVIMHAQGGLTHCFNEIIEIS